MVLEGQYGEGVTGEDVAGAGAGTRRTEKVPDAGVRDSERSAVSEQNESMPLPCIAVFYRSISIGTSVILTCNSTWQCSGHRADADARLCCISVGVGPDVGTNLGL